ncbi:hypothetical protein POSPLADRAFT_1152819 [Postia placenta MAD-698-R-SB12]|uniref:F-box domain-containing protein n=1 Tax=Postia placenta MAD-698-R-SB12 TaxID=670580 RepID=A0A1X6MQG0_9APHY|nr:hypothetical protein POSPLADRAFT_1152819 [Postia placenta MAD-698-R-SB12]OSX58621.1 hypothetical protein POSPLADRAFT_1152819 [Postia placenta MAD-698-R-SB12]
MALLLAILPFPPELLVTILTLLDIGDLCTCRRVCHYFYDLIEGTAALQYKLELLWAGMEDGEFGSLSASDKLQRLRRLQKAWRSLKLIPGPSVEDLGGEGFAVSTDTLVQEDYPERFEFVKLPSRMLGIDECERQVVNIRDWTIGEPHMILLDDSQDLMILGEYDDEPQSDDATGIHLYDLRSYGNWHPHTQVPAFWKMQPEPASRESVQLAVQGAVLGRLSNEHGGAGTFLELGNWRTGRTCAVVPFLPRHEVTSFTFIDQEHVLVATANDLRIYVFDHHRPEMKGAPLMLPSKDYVCSLQLPPLECGMTLVEGELQGNTPAGPSLPRRKPFYTSSRNHIITLKMRVQSNSLDRALVLIIPVPTLRACIARARRSGERRLFWGEWGLSGTRLLSYAWSNLTGIAIRGWKVMITITDHSKPTDRHTYVTLYEFDPAVFERERQVSTTRIWAFSDTEINDMIRFRKPILTSLPFRFTCVKLPLSADVDGCWMLEDAILLRVGRLMDGAVALPYTIQFITRPHRLRQQLIRDIPSAAGEFDCDVQRFRPQTLIPRTSCPEQILWYPARATRTVGLKTMVELDDTYGAILIGSFISAIFFGITNLQVFIYFQQYAEDSSWNKLTVCCLWLLDATHLALCMHMVYWYLVTNFFNPQALPNTVWSFKAVVVVSVHTLYAVRLWKLVDIRSHADTLHADPTSCANNVAVKNADGTRSLFRNVLPIAVGTIVALVGYAYRSHETNWNGKSLLVDSNNRSMPNSFIVLSVEFMLTKLYVNSFLAMFNARNKLRDQPSMVEISEIILTPLDEIPVGSNPEQISWSAINCSSTSHANVRYNVRTSPLVNADVQRTAFASASAEGRAVDELDNGISSSDVVFAASLAAEVSHRLCEQDVRLALHTYTELPRAKRGLARSRDYRNTLDRHSALPR